MFCLDDSKQFSKSNKGRDYNLKPELELSKMFGAFFILNKVGDYLRKIVFRQDIIERPELELSNPSSYGVNTDRALAFFIPSRVGQVGAWILEPEGSTRVQKVILYLHGVEGTRGISYRVNLYNVLLKEGFKILTIDYRGFGDSSDISIDEGTVVQDAFAALDWLRENVEDDCSIFVWGHSMGAGVACHALAQDFKNRGVNTRIDGVILETPFNNFRETFVYVTKKLSKRFWKIALSALYTVTGQTLPAALLHILNMEFNSDFWLPKIPYPVMILAAKEDATVPFELAEKLFHGAKKAGKNNIEFHSFGRSFEHHTIYKSKSLPRLVNNFVKKTLLDKRFFN